MSVILYTTAVSIRSAIGIDENDISDAMLVGCNLDLAMLERLAVIMPTHETAYDLSEDTARRLTLWCQYFGALTLLEDAALGIPQKIQANNDQLSRFTLDFEKIKESLRARIKSLETRLVPTLLPITAPTVMGKSSPSFDPITG